MALSFQPALHLDRRRVIDTAVADEDRGQAFLACAAADSCFISAAPDDTRRSLGMRTSRPREQLLLDEPQKAQLLEAIVEFAIRGCGMTPLHFPQQRRLVHRVDGLIDAL